MTNRLNKNETLERIVKNMDITPTMYRNAEDKYKALAKYLGDNGLECDIYPQGSFSLGTVIKPLKEGKRKEYDLDFICVINNKEDLEAKNFREKIWEILNQNEKKKKRIKEYDKCFTLEYSEINGTGFNIDVLPAKPYINNFILLTNKVDKENVEWFKGNPKGYSEWFKSVNDRYPQAQKINEFNDILMAKESVEELPAYFDRTSLQRVIQILKYHRDYFYHMRRKENKKVISAIITTLCTKIAETTNFTQLNTIDLLTYITSELCIYAQLLSKDNLDQRYTNKTVIKKTNCKWEIINPVNSEDNLADSWNEDIEKPKLFFEWIEEIRKEFAVTNEKEYLSNFSNIFGKENLSDDMKSILGASQIVEPMKPWRK